MQVLSTHISDKRGTDALKRALADIDAPGWCVAFGDRPDMLKAALDERYKGKRIIHVGGGETRRWDTRLTHPDHWTRDALSMIADVHCVASVFAIESLYRIGIPHSRTWRTGCPSLDEIVALSKTPAPKRDGSVFEWFPEFGLSEPSHDLQIPPWLPTNGHRLSEAEFLQRLRTCSLFRTNSSAGLREAPILGTPVEMVGNRQAGRAPAGTYHHPEGRACEEIARICREVCK